MTSYSLLQRDVATYVKKGLSFSYVVLDEAQYVKNAGTLTAKAVKLLESEHRLAITGTPLENGVHELWSIFDFLMPGFLSDATTFRRQFEKPIADKGDKSALERLRRRIRPFLMRRTKLTELKDLPPKIEQERHCQLTPEQLVVYTRLLEQVRTDVFKAVEDKGFAKSRVEILAALTRLRRVCDHPSLVDPRLAKTEELSGKMMHALELVREAVAGGHKVLLFSQFTTMLDLLREAIESSGIGHATIEGKTRDRGEQIKKFNEDPKTSVFLLSLKAGGTGLTLTAADTVIFVRSVVESAGRTPGHGPCAPHRPNQDRERVQARHERHRGRESRRVAKAQAADFRRAHGRKRRGLVRADLGRGEESVGIAA